MQTQRTTITRLPEHRRGDVPAIVFGEIMYAARVAHELGELERARGIAEAAELLSGISAEVLLARLS